MLLDLNKFSFDEEQLASAISSREQRLRELEGMVRAKIQETKEPELRDALSGVEEALLGSWPAEPAPLLGVAARETPTLAGTLTKSSPALSGLSPKRRTWSAGSRDIKEFAPLFGKDGASRKGSTASEASHMGTLSDIKRQQPTSELRTTTSPARDSLAPLPSPRCRSASISVQIGEELNSVINSAPPKAAVLLRNGFMRLLYERASLEQRLQAQRKTNQELQSQLPSPDLLRRYEEAEATYRSNIEAAPTFHREFEDRILDANERAKHFSEKIATSMVEVEKLQLERQKVKELADDAKLKTSTEAQKCAALRQQLQDARRRRDELEQELAKFKHVFAERDAATERLSNLRAGRAGRDGMW
jgi:hypothetical protein